MNSPQIIDSDNHDHPTLPNGMKPFNVTKLLRRVSSAIGLTDTQLKITLAMIDQTRVSDWTDPDAEPVCYAMQTNIAALAGVDERSVRRTEAILGKTLNLARKDVGLSGRRSCYKYPDGKEHRQGICFTPLIEAIPTLLELAQDLDSRRVDRAVLKQKISSGKRQIKHLLMKLQAKIPYDDELKALTDRFLGWPTRFVASTPLSDLEQHLSDVTDTFDTLARLDLSAPSESCQPDSDDRRYIQDTTQEKPVPCNASVHKKPDCKQSDTKTSSTSPEGYVHCKENKDAKGTSESQEQFLASLTPPKLYGLCTDEMRVRISVSQGQRPYPNERDFVHGSIDRLKPLGIHPSAFEDAAECMGDLAAALCVMIIDRNRYHPITPILNPGGVLRAMVRRYRLGELNIVGSLIGLSDRAN